MGSIVGLVKGRCGETLEKKLTIKSPRNWTAIKINLHNFGREDEGLWRMEIHEKDDGIDNGKDEGRKSSQAWIIHKKLSKDFHHLDVPMLPRYESGYT